MLDYSFTFGGVDIRDEYGLIVERFEDVLAPSLRERKIVVPERDGAYDYGAKYYDERRLIVHCASVGMTRTECRELALALSEKDELIRWDETDKYYYGRIYDPTSIQRIAGAAKRFELVFICDPFVYGDQVTETFTNYDNLTYAGSARTPPRITITNNNAYSVNGITITMREAI